MKSLSASSTMMHPMATSATLLMTSGRYWFRRTSGRPTSMSVVPWPRPQRKPIAPAFLTWSRSFSEAIRVVTAARWSGSLACRRPSSRLTSSTIPKPADPCMKPSSQESTVATRAPFCRHAPIYLPGGPGATGPGLRRSSAALEPGAPLVHAPTRAGAREYALDARVHRVQVAEELLQVEVQVPQEVHLVHQHQVGRTEHQGVLEGFLLALGDRVDHHTRVLPDPELGRTNQVPDVLYDEDVYVVQRELGEAGAHHVRVQVALAAEAGVRVHLHKRDVKSCQTVGVEGSLHIALQDAEA